MIEFDTESADEEPKLQRLQKDYNGVIIFIRHILPWTKGSAGLMPPFDKPYRGKKYYLHRTMFVLDVNEETIRDFEWVRFCMKRENE